jgi:hypothetical protein
VAPPRRDRVTIAQAPSAAITADSIANSRSAPARSARLSSGSTRYRKPNSDPSTAAKIAATLGRPVTAAVYRQAWPTTIAALAA